MRNDFESVLNLNEDDFANYFNDQVAIALGREGFAAHLTSQEASTIEEIRRDLYEKISRYKSYGSLHAASAKEMYPQLEQGFIDNSVNVLRVSALVPASAAKAGAVVSEASYLDALEPDSVRRIASYLLPREQVALAKVSKPRNKDLKGTLNSERVKLIKEFLQHVAYGQQAEAEAMLSADRSLLTESGEFTDYSGRRFICSAYEYAYWAKDTHMCRMLAQVDAEGRSHLDEETKTILRERINRMEEIDPRTGQAKGLVYWQNGVEHRSAHFDLGPLMAALQGYIDLKHLIESVVEKRGNAMLTGVVMGEIERAEVMGKIESAWLKVGLAERDVPAHVAQEYCRRDRCFYPTPGFAEEGLPRHLYFPEPIYKKPYRGGTMYWFPLDPGLGFNFSLIRGGYDWVMPAYRMWDGVNQVAIDLVAVTGLDSARAADLTQLRDCLNPPVASPVLSR